MGSEDGVSGADLVQILQQVLLQIHALQNNFHDEVSIGSVLAVNRGLEGSEQLVLALCGHLALAYEELVIVCDNGLAALGELRLDVDHGNVMTCVQEYLSDACAHVASAEYTNFHAKINLSLSLFADG